VHPYQRKNKTGKLVGLGRLELPTRGLGIGQFLSILFVLNQSHLASIVLFWAWSAVNLATYLATDSGHFHGQTKSANRGYTAGTWTPLPLGRLKD
jgi:hypothetical protein